MCEKWSISSTHDKLKHQHGYFTKRSQRRYRAEQIWPGFEKGVFIASKMVEANTILLLRRTEEMISQPLASAAYQSGEEQQLGSLVGIYTRRPTLSGKMAFTGITMMSLFLIIDALLLLVWRAGSALMESSLGFGQLLYLTGSLLAMKWHEEMITPLHPRLSVTVYTDGLLYRKGRTIRQPG